MRDRTADSIIASKPTMGTVRGAGRGAMLWAPYVIPLAYFALVVWIQPAGRLGLPSREPRLDRLLYDDWDWTAVALRALNAERGRVPGAMRDPCVKPRAGFTSATSDEGSGNLKSPYFLEYPNAVVWMFRAGLGRAPNLNAARISPQLLDACQGSIISHRPAGPVEAAMWVDFRRLIRTYEAAMIVCYLGLVAVLRRGYDSGSQLLAPVILLSLPALLYFSLNRFDVLPALLTALSLACLGRKQVAASALFLAAGAMVKVYPALLAPLFVRYLAADRRKPVLWIAAFVAAMVVIFGLTLPAGGWSGALAPFQYQLSRGLEDWSFYGLIIPRSLGTRDWSWLRLAAILVTIGAMCRTPIANVASLLRRSAFVLIIFISLQVFFSPQWIVWLAPLLAPLAVVHHSLVRWLIAFDLVMFLSFPVLYDHPNLHGLGPIAYPVLLYLRFLIPASIAFLLLRWDGSAGRSPGACAAV